MNIKIGTAPDSWGVWFPEDDKQIDCEQCLNEIAKAGYEGIELGPWGYLPNDYDKLNHELEKRGLELVATTLVGDLMSVEETDKMMGNLAQITNLQLKFSNANYIVLIDACYTDLFTGELIRPKTLNKLEWYIFVNNIQRIKNYAMEKYNLEVVFHPHAESHIETEEQIEKLLEDTDVNLCLDTGHHEYTGGDSVAFMKKHHARIPYLHIKSCDMEIKKEMIDKKWPFAEAVKQGIMCEPELGAVDMEAFFNVLNNVGYTGWLVVEQDMYPVPFDKPYPIAERTKNYLEKLRLELTEY